MDGCVLIMAGGTGGHVYPALAVAEQLRAQGRSVVWLGTRSGLEAEVVPRAGVEIEWITISGVRRHGLAAWLLVPFRLLRAMGQAAGVLRRRRPSVALGMGGFVTGPAGLMSWLLRIPLVIHEQNAVPGLTNRLLARLATRVAEAFPGSFGGVGPVVQVGNPVRAELQCLPPPEERWVGRAGPLHLLVLGGSQGAQRLNRVVPELLASLAPEQRPEVWHQCGSRNLGPTAAEYRSVGLQGRLEPYLEDMAAAYGWADLVLCRAGAMTVSELATVGLGAILVPYPYAVDDHQTRNASHLVQARAALLIPDRELDTQRVRAALQELGTSRDLLLARAKAARTLAVPDAASRVAELCLEVAR